MSTKKHNWGLGLLLSAIGFGNLALLTHEARAFTFTSTDNNPTLGVLPTTTNAQSSLNSFIASTSTNTLDFETVATGSGAVFSGGGVLPTVNGITFSTNATITGGGTTPNGVTTVSSDGAPPNIAVGFGTTGTYGTGRFARLDPANTNTFTFNFSAPVSKFGFIITDFGNTPGGPNTISYTFTSTSAISNAVGVIQNSSAVFNSTSRGARFFGVLTDDGLATITQAVFTVNRLSSDLERFGIDDIRINTEVTPIPFEFESATGLIFLGGYFLGKRYLKKGKA